MCCMWLILKKKICQSKGSSKPSIRVGHGLNVTAAVWRVTSNKHFYKYLQTNSLIYWSVARKVQSVSWKKKQIGCNMWKHKILADQDDHNNDIISFLWCMGYKFINELISEIQGALVDSNPIISNYNIYILRLHYYCEQRDTLYNNDNSAIALIDATEQETDKKDFFCEFDDEYISVSDKIKCDTKKLQAREILQTNMYEHINAKNPTSSKRYVYMCYNGCLVDLSSQLKLWDKINQCLI